jgi:FkbM family methyltransferase
MRLELLYNPRILCERLAIESHRRRRLAKLRNTPAHELLLGHIDSLELLELVASSDINVIYDIGASVGTWTVLAKSIISHADLHAFEPLAKHQDAFIDSTQQLNGVTLHRIALGSNDGDVIMHVTNLSDASSILKLEPTGQVQFGVREVAQSPARMWRLDDYRAEYGLPVPDLLKLDVQGYELEVLKGATECLRTARAVIAEVSFIEYYEHQCFFHDLVNYLSEFRLYARAFGVNTPLAAEVNQTDVLFLKGRN